MGINVGLSYEEGFSNIYSRYLNTDIGNKLLSIEGISPDKFDRHLQSKKYHKSVNFAKDSVDNNANATGKNPNNYKGEISKAYDKLDGLYMLWDQGRSMYGENVSTDLIESIINGDVYFHDLSLVDIPYCFAVSLQNLMIEGRPWSNPVSLPPKKLKSFMGQAIELMISMASELAGALALADLVYCMTWYVRNEKTSDEDIKDYLQSLVHILGNPFRTGSQPIFSNISLFCRDTYKQLFEELYYPDMTKCTWEEFDRIQRIYSEWFSKGDPSTNLPYRFPVTTINVFVKDGKPVDKESFRYFTKSNLDKGAFNFYLTSESGKLSSCCRLVNDFNLMANLSTFSGSGGMNIGSARVITINLPRIAYKIASKYPNYGNGEFTEKYLEELDIVLDKTKKLLLIHREILKKRISEGYLQFFTRGYMNLDLHLFSTIGHIGIYEAIQVLHKDPISEESSKIITDILAHMKERSLNWSKDLGIGFNIEAIPGESTAYKLAQKDKILYNSSHMIYSNQYVPLTRKSNVIERLKIAGNFERLSTGGAIVFINIGEQLNSPRQMESLCLAAIKSGVNQFTVNYDYGICSEDRMHVSKGGPNQEYCPICGSKICDHLTRIIGYWVPTSTWSHERQIEHKDRDYNQVISI